jgi:hypothetical protein
MSETFFESIQNYYEQPVLAKVADRTPDYPGLARELLPDVACVALNRLPSRYIRHQVDFAFYLSDKERKENEVAVDEAVTFAFEFVQARAAMRARR